MAPVTTTEQEDHLDSDTLREYKGVIPEIEALKIIKYENMLAKCCVYLFGILGYICYASIMSGPVRIFALLLMICSKIFNFASLGLTYLLDQHPEITMAIFFVFIVCLHRYAIKKKEE